MRHRQFDIGQEKTFVIVFQEGEEFTEGMRRFVEDQQLTAASFTAMRALRDAQFGWLDVDRRDYHITEAQEQVEVLSLVGNASEHEGKPKVHAQVALGK